MTTQSEAALEEGLIKTLVENSYERVVIKEEDNLRENFKRQLEKHNRKELELHGRTSFTEAEFDRILLHLEGGTRFEKAKKLRDLYTLQTDDGENIWVEFLNTKKWCQNEFQVANQISRGTKSYDIVELGYKPALTQHPSSSIQSEPMEVR